MTDAETRAELKRMGKDELLVDWDTDEYSRYALRLLAESQQALREIGDATPSCMACCQLIKIAKTAIKEE